MIIRLASCCTLLIILFSACSASRTLRTDAVDVADSANDSRAGKPGYSKAAAAFLVDAADARLMDIKQGHAAEKHGHDPQVRAYGRLMVREQTSLLHTIQRLANAQHITLPVEISNSKKEAFSQLAELRGPEFDRKFISMMLAEHAQDVDEFSNARKLDNAAVAAFAGSRLPQIRSHLDKIAALRDSLKKQ